LSHAGAENNAIIIIIIIIIIVKYFFTIESNVRNLRNNERKGVQPDNLIEVKYTNH